MFPLLNVSRYRRSSSTDPVPVWFSVAAPENNSWTSVAYGNGVWIAVAADGTNRVMRSTDDGFTWFSISCPARAWMNVYYIPETRVWIASDNSTGGYIMRSLDDGLTWTEIFLGLSSSHGGPE